MSSANFLHFMQAVESPLAMDELLGVLNDPHNHCVFIKNEHSAYCYANENYIRLMGLDNFNQLRGLSDVDLSKNKVDAKKYRALDCCIIEEGNPLRVSEIITPHYNQPIAKTMQGKLYPLFVNCTRANYVLGVVTPESRLLKLDFDTIFSLASNELDDLLIKRSYPIKLSFGTTLLSKMEVRTLTQLLKEQHAGEIAKDLCVKQTTVESYLVNIKNKLGVNNKSDLINRLLA